MNGTNLALTIAGLAIATGVIITVVRRGGARLEYQVTTSREENPDGSWADTWAYVIRRRPVGSNVYDDDITSAGGFPSEAAALAAGQKRVGGNG